MIDYFQITIAIPVYNVEKYIEKSLLSALNQQLSCSYEILVVDDKGNDESMQVVRQLQKTHPYGMSIRVVEHPYNLGLGEARNTAIREAKGKFLFFLDSDDWMGEGVLEKMYAKILETNADFVAGGVCHVYGEGSDALFWQRTHYVETVIEHDGAGYYANACLHLNLHQEWWGKLWNLSFLQDNQIYCKHRIMEDIYPHFIVCAEAKKIALIPDIAIYYNIHESSITTNIRGKKGTDMSAYVYTDVVKSCAELLQNKYWGKVGAYDAYMDRVKDCMNNLTGSSYTIEQMLYIQEHMKNFLSVIPNMRCLFNKHHRLSYIICKPKQTFEWATFAYNSVPNMMCGRVLRNLLNLF